MRREEPNPTIVNLSKPKAKRKAAASERAASKREMAGNFERSCSLLVWRQHQMHQRQMSKPADRQGQLYL